jgi:hypothetical protein
MMAALDAVARPNANAVPRAILRIIDCFPRFEGLSPLLSRFEKPAAEATIRADKDNDRATRTAVHIAERAKRWCAAKSVAYWGRIPPACAEIRPAIPHTFNAFASSKLPMRAAAWPVASLSRRGYRRRQSAGDSASASQRRT